MKRPDLAHRQSIIAYIETVSDVLCQKTINSPTIFSMALLELRWANELLAAQNQIALLKCSHTGTQIHQSHDRRLSTRIAADRPVSVSIDSRKIAGKLIDISQTGARLEVSKGATIGSRVNLALGDEQNVYANVIWRQDDCIGVEFYSTVTNIHTVSRYIVESNLC